MQVRPAEEVEIEQLARIWYDGWQDAHARIAPPELARHRTLESFRERLQARLPNVRTMGPISAPLGFCIVKGDELDQLYVTAAARGTGVAAVLIADAEERLAQSGVEIACLGCAIGNERAARFYEKCNWQRVGTMIHPTEISNGIFPIEVWRYEKRLRPLPP